MKKEEVKRMDIIVKTMEKAKMENKMLTLSCDYITRDRVGKFNVSGIHLGKDHVLPLPTLSVTTETTKEVAAACAMPLELIAASSKKDAAEVYELVDCHMTDSVSHKHLSEIMGENYGIPETEKKGQVFCNIPSTLGAMNKMNQCLEDIEQEIGIKNILNTLVVDVEYEKRHGSLAAQCIYSLLALVDVAHSAKTWNKHAEFNMYLSENNIPNHLFHYKDNRLVVIGTLCPISIEG